MRQTGDVENIEMEAEMNAIGYKIWRFQRCEQPKSEDFQPPFRRQAAPQTRDPVLALEVSLIRA
jgi:hypothetical protein